MWVQKQKQSIISSVAEKERLEIFLISFIKSYNVPPPHFFWADMSTKGEAMKLFFVFIMGEKCLKFFEISRLKNLVFVHNIFIHMSFKSWVLSMDGWMYWEGNVSKLTGGLSYRLHLNSAASGTISHFNIPTDYSVHMYCIPVRNIEMSLVHHAL